MFGKNNVDCCMWRVEIPNCDNGSKKLPEEDSLLLRHSSVSDLLLRTKAEDGLEVNKASNNGKLWSFENVSLGEELKVKRRPRSHHSSPVSSHSVIEKKSGSADSIPQQVQNSEFITKHRSLARLSRSLLGICDRSKTLKKSPHRSKSPIDFRSLRRKSKESLQALLGNLKLSDRQSSELDFHVSVSKRVKEPLHVLLKDLKLSDQKSADFDGGNSKINDHIVK